jgi:hypothetical protein
MCWFLNEIVDRLGRLLSTQSASSLHVRTLRDFPSMKRENCEGCLMASPERLKLFNVRNDYLGSDVRLTKISFWIESSAKLRINTLYTSKCPFPSCLRTSAHFKNKARFVKKCWYASSRLWNELGGGQCQYLALKKSWVSLFLRIFFYWKICIPFCLREFWNAISCGPAHEMKSRSNWISAKYLLEFIVTKSLGPAI